MKSRKRAATLPRRRPKQQRAQHTVEAVLDAVVRILRREGAAAVNTNRIAAVAGVSVGSVYQYFPDKRAIFVALHDRHVEEVGRLIEDARLAHAASPLDDFLRALLELLVEAHAKTPELYELLLTQLPPGTPGVRHLEERLHTALRLALANDAEHPLSRRGLERTLFVVVRMVDALAHGAAIARPANISLNVAKEEAVRAILAYLRA